jgi:hypothetical protein
MTNELAKSLLKMRFANRSAIFHKNTRIILILKLHTYEKRLN